MFLVCVCVFVCFSAESLYRLCHQRQAPDAAHAAEQAELSIQNVGVCGFTAIWVYYHGNDRAQHNCADDEGNVWAHFDTQPSPLAIAVVVVF